MDSIRSPHIWSQSGFYQESIRSPSGVYQESIHFIRSPSGVHQEYQDSWWSPSGCVGECNLQHSINNIIIHIVSDIPFSLLKVDHTVWDECPMSCTCACTLTSRIQVFPMDVAVILRPVITAFRFLGTCQLINSLYSCKNSRIASVVHGLNVPHRAPVLP